MDWWRCFTGQEEISESLIPPTTTTFCIWINGCSPEEINLGKFLCPLQLAGPPPDGPRVVCLAAGEEEEEEGCDPPCTPLLLSGPIWALKRQRGGRGSLPTAGKAAAVWMGSSREGWAAAESFLSVPAWIIHLKFLAEALPPLLSFPSLQQRRRLPLGTAQPAASSASPRSAAAPGGCVRRSPIPSPLFGCSFLCSCS